MATKATAKVKVHRSCQTMDKRVSTKYTAVLTLVNQSPLDFILTSLVSNEIVKDVVIPQGSYTLCISFEPYPKKEG
jgi:hypothetical protein